MVFSIKMYFYGEIWESCSLFLLFFVFFVKSYMVFCAPFFRVFFIFRFVWESCSLFLKKRVKIKNAKIVVYYALKISQLFYFLTCKKTQGRFFPPLFSFFTFFSSKITFFGRFFKKCGRPPKTSKNAKKLGTL